MLDEKNQVELDKTVVNHQKILLAGEAGMLADQLAVLRQQRQKVAMMNGTPPETPEMIVIGDIHNPAPQPVSTPTTPAAPSLLSKLLPAALGAGLMATGAGGAIGLPMLLSALKPSPAPAPVTNTITKEWDSAVDMIVTPPGN
jgi:hypothetical protein